MDTRTPHKHIFMNKLFSTALFLRSETINETLYIKVESLFLYGLSCWTGIKSHDVTYTRLLRAGLKVSIHPVKISMGNHRTLRTQFVKRGLLDLAGKVDKKMCMSLYDGIKTMGKHQ